MKVVKARASVLAQAGEPAAMVKPSADGPFGFDGFRWKGTERGGLTKRAVKLVSAIWPAAEHTCDLQGAIEAVYGDDPPPDDGIGGARKDANNFFQKRRIPLLVKASQLTQHVSIVAAEPQKVTSSAPKKAKQSKKTANRR